MGELTLNAWMLECWPYALLEWYRRIGPSSSLLQHLGEWVPTLRLGKVGELALVVWM